MGSVVAPAAAVVPRPLTLLWKPPLLGKLGLGRAAGVFGAGASVSFSGFAFVRVLREETRGLLNLVLKPPVLLGVVSS